LNADAAILGGAPARTRPFAPVRYTEDDVQRLREVLARPDWGGIPFPNVMHERFRRAFSERLNGVGAVAVSNGTVAISIALHALGLSAGAEVIVPALTWVATAAAAVHVNLVPVLVDVEPGTYCMDPDALEAAITPATRAIVVVHLANQVADMDRILRIAHQHRLHVVEDCAHAAFAEWRSQPVGTLGDAGTFSFESSKIMSSGEGGCVISRHPEVLARAMSLTHVGWKLPPYDGYGGRVFGFNARVSEFQCAIMLGQLAMADELTRRRRALLARLTSGLHDNGGFRRVMPDPRVSLEQIYEVLFRYEPAAFAGMPRDLFCRAVLAEGVEIEGAFYQPLHRSELFRPSSREWPALQTRYGDGFDGRNLHFPVAEAAASRDLLWIHHTLFTESDQDVDDVIEAVLKVQRHAREIVRAYPDG
jgi:dTDP-4-amino-4,6-dideoxygalactose transaminase